MTFTKQNALDWIAKQNTKFARTDREKAKYLVASVLPKEMPHPGLWWEVLKIANGIETK